MGAVLNGQKLPDYVIAEEVVYYTDMTQALADVNSGKVDFFYGLSARLEKIIQQNNFVNLVQVNLVNNSQDITFALKSPAQPELLSILNKAVNNLTDEEKTVINSRNLISIGESRMTLSSIVYANPGLAIAVVTVFRFWFSVLSSWLQSPVCTRPPCAASWKKRKRATGRKAIFCLV